MNKLICSKSSEIVACVENIFHTRGDERAKREREVFVVETQSKSVLGV